MLPLELSTLLHRALEARLDRLLLLTARDGWLQEIEAVHDVRVASRRLRTVLDLSDPDCYPGFRKQRKRAKALTEALGASRELDVHVIQLAQLGSELADPARHAVLEHVLEVFELKRTKARTRMVREVMRVQVSELSGLRDAVPSGTAGDLPAALRTLLEPRLRAILEDARQRVVVEDAPALHRLRIGVKKLRYAIEVLAEALPPGTEKWLARLKGFQGALGEHHDWTTLEAELWELHAQLTDRRRPALAAGTLELLGSIVDRRRMAFEALPTAAGSLDPVLAVEELLPVRGGSPA